MGEQGAPVARGGAMGALCSLARIIYGLLLLAIGGVLALGGARLIQLSGSPYYLAAGLAAAAAGVAVILRRWRWGAAVYLALMAVTLAWSLAEAGLDGWALAPRLISPAVLGLPFLVAAIVGRSSRARIAGWACVALAACLVAGVTLASLYEPAHARPRSATPAAGVQDADWPVFSHGVGGGYFSPLSQINASNAGKLKVAWTALLGPLPAKPYAWMQSIPVKVGDSLYICEPTNNVTALDPQTGKVRWRYEAHNDFTGLKQVKCRGVGYYAQAGATGLCATRVFTATMDARLIALDARTGTPCPGFGTNGIVDLKVGQKLAGMGYYSVTSPPLVARGKVLVGAQIPDGQYVGEPSGVIRAYDAVTGKLAWAWDIGRPGQHGEVKPGEFYTPGTPNAWGPMAADEQLGLIYVPVGAATPDYWGGHRSAESNRYGNSVTALDAETGEPRWTFQLVHYDIWDYDVSAQPTLYDLPTKAGVVPVVVQSNKRGQVFVLDRRTGAPVFPVVERPAPQGGAVEKLSPTQPWSPAMPDLAGAKLTEASMWGITAVDQLWCRIKFREARYEGQMTPTGTTPSIAEPGYTGGVNWASAAIDPARGIAFYASNHIANYNRLLTRAESDRLGLKPTPGGTVGLAVAQAGTPYGADITPFLSPLKAPCQAPPHGRLNAIDLKTGKLLWSRAIGSARDSGPMNSKSGLPFTIGTPTFGGPMTTAGGVVFIGATRDHAFRAYDSESGKLLFEADLPDSNSSTASTFLDASGRQVVTVTSNAAKDGKSYAAVTAFALR